jgi:hypothetical protein
VQEHAYVEPNSEPPVKVWTTRIWAQFPPNRSKRLVQKPLKPDQPQRNLSFAMWPMQGASAVVRMQITASDYAGNHCVRDLVLTRSGG